MSSRLFDNINSTQEKALYKIGRLESRMRTAWDEKYLEQLYEEAMNLWWDELPSQANQLGDKLRTIRIYNDQLKDIRKQGSVTINLFGCNVTINTAATS